MPVSHDAGHTGDRQLRRKLPDAGEARDGHSLSYLEPFPVNLEFAFCGNRTHIRAQIVIHRVSKLRRTFFRFLLSSPTAKYDPNEITVYVIVKEEKKNAHVYIFSLKP